MRAAGTLGAGLVGRDGAPAGASRAAAAAPRARAAPTGSGSSSNSEPGRAIDAVIPDPGVGESTTRIPCRAASRATTWKPSRFDTDRSTSGGSASRVFAAARSASSMPTPQSSTVSS